MGVHFQKEGKSTKQKTKVSQSRTEIQKQERQTKGDFMTQEEELKKGEVEYKKSSDSLEKKREGEGNLCNLNQW